MSPSNPAPPWSRRRALLLLAATALPAARADEVAPADARRIQAVIGDQLAAFAADDAPRAFSHATAALQRQFGSADHFMAMVRATYPAVVRPVSVAYLLPERTEGQWTQGVHLTDAQGARWLAVYVMERGAGGKPWRIAGCTLVPAAGRTARAGSTSTARA